MATRLLDADSPRDVHEILVGEGWHSPAECARRAEVASALRPSWSRANAKDVVGYVAAGAIGLAAVQLVVFLIVAAVVVS